MSLVIFKHGQTLPNNPDKGTFYWIENNGKSELWFASADTEDGLIRLDNYFTDEDIEELVTRLEGAESDIESIQEILDEINDNIENIVNNKLTWKII